MVLVVILLTTGLALGRIRHPDDEDLTSRATRASWVLRLQSGSGPTVQFDIDQETGWTKVTDSRAPGRAMWAHNDVIYVEADLAALGIKKKRYIAASVRSIMPQPIDLSPAQIAPSLDRHWRECSPPSAIEAVYIDYFLSSTGINLSGKYTICGRTSYSAFGNQLIHADDLFLEDPFKIPSAEDAVGVSDLGEPGSAMLKDLTADFGGHS